MPDHAIHKRWPLVVVCLCLMAGFATAHFLPLSLASGTLYTVAVALLVMFLSAARSHARARQAALALLLTCFAAWYYTYRYRHFPPHHVEHLATEESRSTQVHGVVVDDPVVRRSDTPFRSEHARRRSSTEKTSRSGT